MIFKFTTTSQYINNVNGSLKSSCSRGWQWYFLYATNVKCANKMINWVLTRKNTFLWLYYTGIENYFCFSSLHKNTNETSDRFCVQFQVDSPGAGLLHVLNTQKSREKSVDSLRTPNLFPKFCSQYYARKNFGYAIKEVFPFYTSLSIVQ